MITITRAVPGYWAIGMVIRSIQNALEQIGTRGLTEVVHVEPVRIGGQRKLEVTIEVYATPIPDTSQDDTDGTLRLAIP